MEKIFINLPRRAGKTTQIIELAEKTWKYILCLNRQRQDEVWKLAKQQNKNIRFPITFIDLPGLRGNEAVNEILIDDFDQIVQQLIYEKFKNVKIIWATTTTNNLFDLL